MNGPYRRREYATHPRAGQIRPQVRFSSSRGGGSDWIRFVLGEMSEGSDDLHFAHQIGGRGGFYWLLLATEVRMHCVNTRWKGSGWMKK